MNSVYKAILLIFFHFDYFLFILWLIVKGVHTWLWMSATVIGFFLAVLATAGIINYTSRSK